MTTRTRTIFTLAILALALMMLACKGTAPWSQSELYEWAGEAVTESHERYP